MLNISTLCEKLNIAYSFCTPKARHFKTYQKTVTWLQGTFTIHSNGPVHSIWFPLPFSWLFVKKEGQCHCEIWLKTTYKFGRRIVVCKTSALSLRYDPFLLNWQGQDVQSSATANQLVNGIWYNFPQMSFKLMNRLLLSSMHAWFLCTTSTSWTFY